METRQLEHEGFEHTDEFRVPVSEWYQGSDGREVAYGGGADFNFHSGKRWILRKKPPQVGNHKRDEAIKLLEGHIESANYYIECLEVKFSTIKQALEKLKEV